MVFVIYCQSHLFLMTHTMAELKHTTCGLLVAYLKHTTCGLLVFQVGHVQTEKSFRNLAITNREIKSLLITKITLAN